MGIRAYEYYRFLAAPVPAVGDTLGKGDVLGNGDPLGKGDTLGDGFIGGPLLLTEGAADGAAVGPAAGVAEGVGVIAKGVRAVELVGLGMLVGASEGTGDGEDNAGGAGALASGEGTAGDASGAGAVVCPAVNSAVPIP